MVNVAKSKWCWAILAAGGLLAGWYFFAGDKEPTYEGKTLSSWFREYYSTHQGSESAEALQALGTNAVPYLLEQAFDPSRDSAFQTNVYAVLNGTLPRSWKTRFISADERRGNAGFALKLLNPPAALMMPVLKKYLTSTNQPGHYQALYLLGTIGDGAEQGVPYLEAAVKGKDWWARILALQALGWLGPKAKEAVPAILDVLKEPPGTNSPQFPAIIALGGIGSNAAPAVPLLKERFGQETNSTRKARMAAVLVRIDETQVEALNFLLQRITNSGQANQATSAIYELGEIGPNAKGAASFLLERIDNAQGLDFLSASVVLKKIGVPAATICARMKKHLAAMDDWTRVNAAMGILQIDPGDHDGHVAALHFVITLSPNWRVAIDALRRAGPAAAEVLPQLREVWEKAPDAERKEILKAIKRIEGKKSGD